MRQKIRSIILPALIALVAMSTSVNSQNFNAPRSMGTVFNSTSDDGNPVISSNGLSFYFSSNRAGNNDIYVSHRATLTSPWNPPVPVTPLNSSAADTPGSISLDGKTMFIQSNRMPAGLGGRDIYISTRTDPNNDLDWSTPINLGNPVNTERDELAPSYFEDPAAGERVLIFGTDRVGNPGSDYHLYQSSRNTNGTFNAPTLIPELTVGGAEIRAAVRRDGLEIFICAIGPPPGPSFDIWVSHRASVNSAWSSPSFVPNLNSDTEERFVSLSPDDSILYYSSTRRGGYGIDVYSATRCSLYADAPCTIDRPAADFDGDGRTDLSVFRPSEGNWYIMKSGTNTFRGEHFGANGDKIVPGDYDGDAILDLAVFRPTDRNWYILKSSDHMISTTNWGLASDKPVPGDYDGDGRTDAAVYRDGTWYILQSSTGQFTAQQFGLAGDIPIAGTNAQ